MPTKLRLQRIADRLRQELSEMLVLGDIQDPRIANANVTDVKVDKELSYADIYISSFEGAERSKEILQGFESARPYIRRVLADRVELRVFPRLRFHWDPTPEKADRIERIIYELHKDDPAVIPKEETEEDDE